MTIGFRTPSSFLTVRDDEILGVSNSIDGMGVLAVWSTRGRDLVPHLTAQTTSARGFQVLLEAMRLVEVLADDEPVIRERTADVFILIEQMVARIIAQQTGDWSLPGARRARGRIDQSVEVSLADRSWHLLGSQRGNGLWGLYRGAAFRAGLLDHTLERLSDEAMDAAIASPVLSSTGSLGEVRDLVLRALDGESVPLDTTSKRALLTELMTGWETIPLRDLLWEHLMQATPLTTTLTTVLLEQPEDESIDHRRALARTAALLPDEAGVIDDVVRCEDYLSVLEAVFLFTCAAGDDRLTLVEASQALDLDLPALRQAADGFSDSGRYDGVAQARARDYVDLLRTDSTTDVLDSVLDLHGRVARGRGRALWVWLDEHGRFVADVGAKEPDASALEVGSAWRNDYFLSPLRSVARELEEVRS